MAPHNVQTSEERSVWTPGSDSLGLQNLFSKAQAVGRGIAHVVYAFVWKRRI